MSRSKDRSLGELLVGVEEKCHISGEGFFDLGGELVGESVEALRKVANELKKIVVGDEGGDGGEETSGGGDEGFRDAGSDGAKAGGAGSAESGESINDAPDGSEETNEGSNPGGGSEPGHALFDAANFFGGGKLHIDGDGLHAFKFGWRGRGAGGGELGLEFPVAGSVDIGERRASRDESLGIGNAFGGAKDFEELIALAANAAEEAEFLENHRPGDQGEEQK